MCQAFCSGILRLEDKLDTVTASKSLQLKRGEGGKTVAIKGSNPRQNEVCTVREHWAEWKGDVLPAGGTRGREDSGSSL